MENTELLPHQKLYIPVDQRWSRKNKTGGDCLNSHTRTNRGNWGIASHRIWAAQSQPTAETGV